MSKVIFYTETKGALQGQIFAHSFVDNMSATEINAKLAQLTEQGYLGLNVGSWMEFTKADLHAGYSVFNTYQVQPTCADTFNRMLLVLPPKSQQAHGEFEAFHISEHIGSGLYSFFIRLEDKFFKIVADSTASMHDLVNTCKQSLEAA